MVRNALIWCSIEMSLSQAVVFINDRKILFFSRLKTVQAEGRLWRALYEIYASIWVSIGLLCFIVEQIGMIGAYSGPKRFKLRPRLEPLIK